MIVLLNAYEHQAAPPVGITTDGDRLAVAGSPVVPDCTLNTRYFTAKCESWEQIEY